MNEVEENVIRKQIMKRLGKRLGIKKDTRIDLKNVEIEVSVNSFNEITGASRLKACEVVIYRPWTEHKKGYNLVHYASVYKYSRDYDDEWIWNGHYNYSFKKKYSNCY